MRKNSFWLLWALFFPCFNNESRPASPGAAGKTNILLIVADDLGYTDLGCFGGDIHTPNIDSLAARGLLFNRFHTSPLCAPTRSMVLSGNNNHIAGMGSMFDVNGTPRANKPGYEHHLSDRIVTVAQLLKDGGYHTYMAGKWHLGMDAKNIPYAKGFEKSFALLDGGANHFNNNPIFDNRPPQYRLDSQAVKFPEGRFSTEVYTDEMIGFIRNSRDDAPFFGYLTYTAPHWPLQAPEEYLDKYKGKYDIGYDSLRVERFRRQKAMGIIPAGVELPPRLGRIKPWKDLTAGEKKIEARKMEIYAAMVDNLDKHIGRLIQYLRESKRLDNTLIVFMADNGAAGEDFYNSPDFGPYLRQHYNNEYENMGKPSSFVAYGPQWAQAGAAPFTLYKEYPTEGGVNTPLIISGSGVARKPGIQQAFINVMDLAPTFLEIADLSYPDEYKGKKLYPPLGESALSYIRGSKELVHDSNYVYCLEHYGGCLLIKGNWKITNRSDPFDEKAFALYNFSGDWGETKDLSRVNPGKFREMMGEWEVFKKKAGILPLEQGERIHLDDNK